MEQYQTIYEHAIRNFGQSGTAWLEDIFPVISDEVLLIDIESKKLINNHAVFTYPNLELLVGRGSVRYIIVTQTFFPASGKILTPPSRLARSGWGHSLWQTYTELYHNAGLPLQCPGLLAKLQVMEKILELCNLQEIRKAYEHKDIVNIFGWLYDSGQKKIEDTHTDLLLTLDETLLYKDNPEYIGF